MHTKKHQTSHILWKCLCLSGFQDGRSCLETSLRPPIDLPSDLPSSSMKRNNLVVGHVRMFLVLKAEFLHCCANADLRTMSARHGRIFPLDDLQHLRAVHRLYDLIFLWLAETGYDDLRDVLLLHILLIQLLDAGHLLVVEPIRRLQLLQLIHHLSIQLTIIDLARVVNQLTVRNLDADVTSAAC